MINREVILTIKGVDISLEINLMSGMFGQTKKQMSRYGRSGTSDGL